MQSFYRLSYTQETFFNTEVIQKAWMEVVILNWEAKRVNNDPIN